MQESVLTFKNDLCIITRNLAMAAGEKGVRVNSVNPGTVRTSLFKNAGLLLAKFELILFIENYKV